MFIAMNRFKVIKEERKAFEDFTAWTKSEKFRAAHQHAGERKPLTLGHPEFEGFEVIQTIETAHSPG